MNHGDITSLRATLEFLKQKGQLLTVKREVDPIYEISGIQKATENGPALLFENVKGYPGVRDTSNIFNREEMVAGIFDVPDYKDVKFKCVAAIKEPLPPRVVEKAPCQEVVITDDIDVARTLPLLKHSEVDAGRILGGGITLLMPPYCPGGSDLAFKRMHFRGKDWSPMEIQRASHLGLVTHKPGRIEAIPLTINIGAPPAVIMVASTSTVHAIMPQGIDELGIAGAMQGSPIEICRARTVDTYAIANSEWTLEGYLTTEKVWETEEAERLQKRREAPLFPEWSGYLGRATQTFKFQVTAITHRKDSPIFYSILPDSYDYENVGTPLRAACLYEIAQRMVPGLVADINILHGFKGVLGAIFQVKKRNSADDAFLRNIAAAAIPTSLVRVAIIVDEDVDIYDAEDVWWAVASRTNLRSGIFTGAPNSIGLTPLPFTDVGRGQEAWSEGGLVIDATVPFRAKGQFQRAHYPVDRVKLSDWFAPEEIAAIQAQQSQHARLLARIGG